MFDKIQKWLEIFLALRYGHVILVDLKGRKLDPIATFSSDETSFIEYKKPFLTVSTPACRPPEEFKMGWREAMAGHPDADRILETLQKMPPMQE